MSGLRVLRIGPMASVQDLGRPGLLADGVAQGGAADQRALAEGAALLGQNLSCAALELGGVGGVFEVTGSLRVAFTGAPMSATCDGVRMAWNASYQLKAGQLLEIGAATRGVYGYLHLGGGIDVPLMLGARAAHVGAGLGRMIQAGDTLRAGPDQGTRVDQTLRVADRFGGGGVRLVESFQSDLFSGETRARFTATAFRRGARANRMGVELVGDGRRFTAIDQLNVLSEVIVPGDVQMTGEGTPFVLMREHQTTGGYPRIGSVLPSDLPRIAQSVQGDEIRFQWVTLDQALDLEARDQADLRQLPQQCQPLLRDPSGLSNLLSMQLIGGAVSATADPFAKGAY